MKTKRIVCAVLCLIMLSAVLAACTDGGNETSNPQSKADTSSTVSTENSEASSDVSEEVSVNPLDKYIDSDNRYSTKNLPAFKDEWKNYETFTVLVYSDAKQKTYYSEEIEPLYETTDQAIIDAVNTRNEWILDNYGIRVKALPVEDVLTAARSEFTSGLHTFDAALPFMASAATLAQEGLLNDLTSYEGIIDLEAPWWDQNATEAVSINGHVFFSASDMTIMQKIVSSGIAFNTELMSNYFPNYDIYEEVKQGRWTIDTLYQMSKTVTTSLVDDDVMDEKDQWGILDTGPSFFYGCGEQLITKNAEDLPILALGKTERSVNAAKKVLTLTAERKTWMATVDDWTDRNNIYNTIVEVFGNGRSLFMALHFSAIKKLRNYDAKFGIVPAAKYNEDQDDYFTKCSANYAYGVCVPVTALDDEFSAYMCELMAIGGKNDVANAYYDVVLKGKDMKDENSEAMLDLIFDSIVYDPAVIYGFSGLNTLLDTMAKEGNVDIVSKLTELEGSINDSIETVIDAYNAAS